MIPIALVFRGMFLVSILFWYSTSVWKMMDSYFRDEFKKYLVKEKEENKHLEIGIPDGNENTMKVVHKLPLDNENEASDPKINSQISYNKEKQLKEQKEKHSVTKNQIHLKEKYLDSYNNKKIINNFDIGDEETCPILNEPYDHEGCESP